MTTSRIFSVPSIPGRCPLLSWQKESPSKRLNGPKSREETPKEGSDMQTHTAPQQYYIALHKISRSPFV